MPKFHKTFVFVFFAIAALMNAPVVYGGELDKLNIPRSIKLPDGKNFSFTISNSYWDGKVYKDAQLWGAWGTTPSTVISRLTVTRAGEKLYIPFSAYSDLSNLQSTKLTVSGRVVELVIDGGTGGDAYRAVLAFPNGKYLESRKVFSAVMPKDAHEYTQYKILSESKEK